MSEVQNQNQDKKESLTKILFDISSEPGYDHKIHVEGNQGVLIDILVQVFEHPSNEQLSELFFLACEEYYTKHPEQRPIL